MRFSERFPALRDWLEKELCQGRLMKAPAKNFDISEIREQEPKCYLAWAPTRLDDSQRSNQIDYKISENVVPGIIVMPAQTYAAYMEEQRFDRYNNIHRPKELGQHLYVQILFAIYEPGIRLPGFVDSVGEHGKGMNLNLMREGTEEGLLVIFDWMDDCISKILGAKVIPGTDLFVEEATTTYSLYVDQAFVQDRRPIFYGFVNVSFGCAVNEAYNEDIEELLR